MPHLHVSDGTVEGTTVVGPSGEAKPVLGASHDVGLVCFSIGADEEAVLIHFYCRVLDGGNNMRPCRPGIEVAG